MSGGYRTHDRCPMAPRGCGRRSRRPQGVGSSGVKCIPRLPIIGSAIPIIGFYWAAPLILVSIYLYLLLYLHRLWESMAKLPAVFPDGTPLDEKVYPWLPNSLVASHFALLKEKRPALSGLQSFFSSLLVYGVVPVTLASVWVRYLTRQDWPLTRAHIALLVLTTVGAIMFRRLAGETLEGTERQPFDWSRTFDR